MATSPETLDGATLLAALGGQDYSLRLAALGLVGYDRVNRVLGDLARKGRIGELSRQVDPTAYALARAFQTERLDGLVDVWLRNRTVLELCDVVAELVNAGLTIDKVAAWLNDLPLVHRGEGRIEREKQSDVEARQIRKNLEDQLERDHYALQLEYAAELGEEDEHAAWYNALNAVPDAVLTSYDQFRAAFLAAYQREVARV